MCGSAGAGKTSLFRRIVTNQFSLLHAESATAGKPVIGARSFDLAEPDGFVTVELWDVSGEAAELDMDGEPFASAQAVIVVADASRAAHLRHAEPFVDALRERQEGGLIVTVVCTKMDLAGYERHATVRQAGTEWARQRGTGIAFVSSKKGTDVLAAIKGLLRAVHGQQRFIETAASGALVASSHEAG